jgi:DNA polymerase-3 subunit delta'
MSNFDIIIGQDAAVADLKRAASEAARDLLGGQSNAMTHAWLFTGPPGSGRSTLALAFAATLVCAQGGCGTCQDCRNALAGIHPDVEHVVPEKVHYAKDAVVALIERAALLPTRAPWHVIVVEDVDRILADAASVLLKSIEEPPAQTVWLLCAPTGEDVFETIKSRCRQVSLVAPELESIAEQLATRFGIEPSMAKFAARVSQGHIGRARALATDEKVRSRRREILEIPARINTVSSCYSLAAQLVATINADVDDIMSGMLAHDEEELRMVFGEAIQGKGMKAFERQKKSAIKASEDRHKTIRRRILNDQYNRALMDLTGFYRDVLVVQSGSAAALINEELRNAIDTVADKGDSASMLQRIDAIAETLDNLLANVVPQAAFESLLVTLRDPALSTVHN